MLTRLPTGHCAATPLPWSGAVLYLHPQLDGGGFDGPALPSYLRRAEQLGFEGGWTLEQTIGAGPMSRR
jgi:hypothetical protein